MLLRFALIAGLLAPLTALGQPVLYIEPEAVGEVAAGESFTVDVRIADYEDLRAYSVDLHYNQAAIKHTNLTQGTVFSANGGPGGIFLTAASDPERGYIKADEARVTGGSTSGDDGFLFRVTFLAIAPGSTNIDFGQTQLRNAANQPLAFDLEGGAVAVVSPVPDLIHTRIFDPGEGSEQMEEWANTGGWVHVADAGVIPHGKLSVARYASLPPGGEDAPFVDPDGHVLQLGVTSSYWELTSSLSDAVTPSFGFSYSALDGPPNLADYRVARRSLGSTADSTWTVLPSSATIADPELQLIVIDGFVVPFEAGQYALVFDRIVSSTDAPGGIEHIRMEVYPNPAYEKSTVRFKVPRQGQVGLEVVDVLGRVVLTLVDDSLHTGIHEVRWSARSLPSGGYFVILSHAAGQDSARITVVR